MPAKIPDVVIKTEVQRGNRLTITYGNKVILDGWGGIEQLPAIEFHHNSINHIFNIVDFIMNPFAAIDKEAEDLVRLFRISELANARRPHGAGVDDLKRIESIRKPGKMSQKKIDIAFNRTTPEQELEAIMAKGRARYAKWKAIRDRENEKR